MASQRTKYHRQWHKELKDWFSSWMGENQFCESCGDTRAMIYDMAHRKKRKFIGYKTDRDKAEYFMALHLCRECHLIIETGSHDNMYRLFMEILKDCRERKYGNIL